MAADGSGQHPVTSDPGFAHFEPSWSPDGRRIVLSRCNVQFGFSAYCDIARIDADGSHRRTLVAGYWFHARARYSPGGRKLAFFSNKGGFQGAVWTADADGGNLRRLTAPALEGFWPEWSPNGHRIVFSSDRRYPDVCCTDLYVMRSDGSALHQVPTGDLAGVVDPDWGSAPRDTGTGAARVVATQRTPARVGSTASAPRLCAVRPEARLTGRCGLGTGLDKRGAP